MRFVLLALVIFSVSSAALAQEPQKMTPSQLALGIDGAVNQLAQALEKADKDNASLQDQLKRTQAQLDIAKKKSEQPADPSMVHPPKR